MDKHPRCAEEGCQVKEGKGYQDCEQHSGCCAILSVEKHPDRLILDLYEAAKLIGYATSAVERQSHRQAADIAAARLQEALRSTANSESAPPTEPYVPVMGGISVTPGVRPPYDRNAYKVPPPSMDHSATSETAPPSEPGRIPALESTRTNADYWLKAAREAEQLPEQLICAEQAINAWKNAAYAAHDKLAIVEASNKGMFERLAPSVEYVEGTAVGWGEDEIDRLRHDLERATANHGADLTANSATSETKAITLPLAGVLNVDDPADKRNREWGEQPSARSESNAINPNGVTIAPSLYIDLIRWFEKHEDSAILHDEGLPQRLNDAAHQSAQQRLSDKGVPTPRTDAAAFERRGDYADGELADNLEVVPADVARQLERDLADALLGAARW